MSHDQEKLKPSAMPHAHIHKHSKIRPPMAITDKISQAKNDNLLSNTDNNAKLIKLDFTLNKDKAAKLILFSNSQLTTAISLYEKYGFKHIAATDSPFLTADIKMELSL